MAGRYHENYITPEVREAQEHYYGRSATLAPQPERDLLTEEEAAFIAQRDSFYMATVTSNGWPYLQHRGGQKGFLKIVEPNVLAFADFRGNRQLLSTGNLVANNRVALFLMDYARRERLKIMGLASVLDARDHSDLAAQLTEPGKLKIVERIFRIEVVSYDWNCSQHITPRFTEEEIQEATKPLLQRISELERKLANLDSDS